ncbi:DUF262 domain-containing protein [Pseudomonadota bacterium]
MKNFDTRVYSISDFAEWDRTKLLDISPDFQRRSVWSEKAKSYLIDTIIRGKPIPKLLITQDLKAHRNVRVVVDGQQRLRAILGFIDGDFKISSAHNKEFARKTFSQLPEEVMNSFLKYEIGVDLLYDVPYGDLLDIFARINTYTVKLNKQEQLNAKYLGYFKGNAYKLGYRYVDYFVNSKVITKAQVSRMGEAELASDLLVSILDGIQSNKNVESFYKSFEDEEGELPTACDNFDTVMSFIGEIYPPEELANTNWSRVQLFYTLFTSIAYGLSYIDEIDGVARPKINKKTIGKVRVRLDEISDRFDQYTHKGDASSNVPKEYEDFITHTRRATTDSAARLSRAKFVCTELKGI